MDVSLNEKKQEIQELLSDSDEDVSKLMGIYYIFDEGVNPIPQRISKTTGHEWVVESLNGHPNTCVELFRMNRDTFINLCEELKRRSLLFDSKFLSVHEQLAMFLTIVGQNERQRIVGDRFQHSIDTISRNFNKVLKALSSYAKIVITPPNLNETPPEIRTNSKYFPFFKDCVGVVDGTHISARIATAEQIPFRGKKIATTQNILCVCSFDMRFTFVMTGWEGTANDSRVLMETISHPQYNFPMPPRGKYYLADSGYTNMPGFLTPYRGERYHLRDYRQGHRPQSQEELFNYMHSSLRNMIERCFGVLKARFPILSQMPCYQFKRQKYIVLTCCVLHNFIKMGGQLDKFLLQYADENVDVQVNDGNNSSDSRETVNVSQSQLRQMGRVRDSIAQDLWQRHNN